MEMWIKAGQWLLGWRAATRASLAPIAAILASSQNFEIDTGLTKPEDKLASFEGMYSGDCVRDVK